MKRLQLARIAAAALATAMIAAATPSFAKKVSNSTAASLQTQCLLEDDHHTSGTNSRFTRCCSYTLGYCIECTMDASEKCEKISIRQTPGRDLRPQAPGPGTVAPATSNRRQNLNQNGVKIRP